ncbi:MAG TPA: NmrA/HSCARG family protein [Gemmatimonadales bacterium]|nr:NmrA/HSCARG family protein [Gemmatimonadales bacterium]
MAKDKNLILVSGATGQQGGAVARELLARGHAVRAMTRKPDSPAAQALAQRGVEVIKGDLDDPASLTRALQGAWGVFAVQNTWEAGVEREEAQGKRIAELARKSGVQHYVYTSVGSAHRKTGIPHFDNKWRVEETVRRLGFPSHVIIRPVFFMENFLSAWFKPGIDQGKLMIGLKPTTVLQMIAVSDVGKYGALAFEKHKELNRQEIDIAGDAHTMPDTAKILSKATGRTITFEQVPIAEVRKASEDYALMLDWFDRVGYNADIPALAKRYGIKPTSLAEWAATAKWS